MLSLLVCLTTSLPLQTTRPASELPKLLAEAAPNAVIVVGDGVIPGGLTIKTYGVTVRAENKWRTVISGGAYHGVYVTGINVTLDGLQIMGARYSGVKSDGDETKVLNCWVHHNGLNGIEGHNRKKMVIERNLVERNGTHPNLCHGLYVDGTGGLVSFNVVRHNAAMGIACGGAASSFVVARNVCHDNGTDGIGVWRYYGSPNNISGNTLARNRYGIRLVGVAGDVVSHNALWKNKSGDFLNQTTATIPPQGTCPTFVDPEYGVFWPKAATDVGAYEYDATRSRLAWPYNPWAYQFDPAKGQPDLWEKP